MTPSMSSMSSTPYFVRSTSKAALMSCCFGLTGDDTPAGLSLVETLAVHAAALILVQDGPEAPLSPGIEGLARLDDDTTMVTLKQIAKSVLASLRSL